MTSGLDWALTNTTLPDRPGRWCIGLANGAIATLQEGDCLEAEHVWDVGGRLVVPGFIDAHTHLDKALTADRAGDVFADGSLATAIQTIRTLKQGFTTEDLIQRATEALHWSLTAGTTVVRTNVEADPFLELRAIEALQQVQQHMRDRIELQLIAFPQEGWFKTENSLELGVAPYIEQALQKGVEVIGGNINQGLWPSSPEAQVDELLSLAQQYDCDIDVHLDNWDGPEAFTLPYLAQKTIEAGWQGRVNVGHIASLAHVSDTDADAAIALVKQAGISVTVLPTRMKLTRVVALLEAGVNVVCATDNLRDPFVRHGKADPLAALLLLAQITGFTGDRQLNQLWHTITTHPARMMRRANYGLEPGCQADLVVLDATTIPEAILYQANRLAVFKQGKLQHTRVDELRRAIAYASALCPVSQ
ncbi:amidohydrolase family protein [Leptolyngbya sp. AN02str]|uniref:amidohydrolase family protein n=1 Tax=Leptolyngbya sp. AN02str TaxID=3423363 RepID=UPI003D319F88